MDPEENRIIITRDGSPSIYSDRFHQHYHNPNGAVSENDHVFIKPSRLADKLRSVEKLNILEIGFGTGLNLLLTAGLHEKAGSQTRITYQTVEAYPISSKTARELDYEPFVSSGIELKSIFTSLHPGQNIIPISDMIELRLFYGFFDQFDPESWKADIIFFDAFSPGANPDLWTGEVFRRLKNSSKESVIMTTYCAASMARAAMAWGGWCVARAPGALGKREMTVAALNPALISNYERLNEERLSARYASPKGGLKR